MQLIKYRVLDPNDQTVVAEGSAFNQVEALMHFRNRNAIREGAIVQEEQAVAGWKTFMIRKDGVWERP